jgi:hypothetical protein
MQNKWHLCKEDQRRQQKKTTPRLVCFLNYLASFGRPPIELAQFALDLTWEISRSRSYEFLWADSIIQLCEEMIELQLKYGGLSSR